MCNDPIQLLLAGFGGQGILFAGKAAAYAGMAEEKNVTWLPSYGPEMRGGTANCSVCVSKAAISCPIVFEPNLLVVMNQPSFHAFVEKVVPGGVVVMNSSLIKEDCLRPDVTAYAIPATELVEQNDLPGLANIIMLGYAAQVTGAFGLGSLQAALGRCVPLSKQQLLEPNLHAVQIGWTYKEPAE